MIVKTRIFESIDKPYRNLSELAQAMGISVSQIYRVRQGKRKINQRFIVGAIIAYPGRKFDDLFYFAPEMPVVNGNNRHESLTAHSIDKQTVEDKQQRKSMRQTVGVA